MILKRKTQNALSLQLLLIFFLIPNFFIAQNTIPSTTVSGCLKVDGSSRIDSSLVVGDTMKAQDVTVSGNAIIAGDINLGGKLLYDATNNIGVGFKSGLGVAPDIFTLGKLGNPSPPVNPCLVATLDPWVQFIGGRLQLFDATANVALTMGSDNVQSSIDASGNNGLLVNYYCGKNIYLGTGVGTGGSAGTAGAIVYAGDKVHMRTTLKIGDSGNGNFDLGTALDLYNGANSNWNGIRFTTPWNNVKLISIDNPNFLNRSPILMLADGRTSIGPNHSTGNVAPYKMLTVNGDVSLANYAANGNTGFDGTNGIEILGNDQIPTRMGIATKSPKLSGGDFNFYISNLGGPATFRFKNGLNATTPNVGSSVPDLVTIESDGNLTVNPQHSSVDAFNIKDPSANKINFKIKANGKTEIHIQSPNLNPNGTDAFEVINDLTGDVNFRVKATGFVYAREVEVKTGSFPDYVFHKKYKMLDILDLDKYIKENKHLPGFNKGEYYVQNGLKTSEMFIKHQEKIEEAFLYIIELKKENEVLKARLEALENKK